MVFEQIQRFASGSGLVLCEQNGPRTVRAKETKRTESSFLARKFRKASSSWPALSLATAYNALKFKQNIINFEKQRQHGLVLRSLTTEKVYPIEIIELKSSDRLTTREVSREGNDEKLVSRNGELAKRLIISKSSYSKQRLSPDLS